MASPKFRLGVDSILALRQKALILFLSLGIIATVACGGTVTTDTQSSPETFVTLPNDEAPHDSGIEWWYFNGLFTDNLGQEYSYHYVTFQSQEVNSAVPHLLQASLGVHSAERHLIGEKIILSSLDPDAVGVDVTIDGWEMLGDGEFYNLKFALDEYTLDLKTIPTRPPILHQGGLVNLGPAGETFYYTRTRLDTTGSININGEQRSITGVSWMDHQWGDILDLRVGWDWAGVQLDDGSDLMAVQIWDPGNKVPFSSYGTLLFADGSTLTLDQSDLSITSEKTWTSPDTSIEYPSGWSIDIPSQKINLKLEPILVNSEFYGSQFTPAAYWEGEVKVTGTRQGETVSGRGFVELVGYDPNQLNDSADPAVYPRP